MPKPQIAERTRTTISVSKEVKQKIRRCAQKSTTRKGNETDEQIIDRIVTYYIQRCEVSSEPISTF